jgi:hypothetical protein
VDVGVGGGAVATQPTLGHKHIRVFDIVRALSRPVVVQSDQQLKKNKQQQQQKPHN